MQKKTVQMAKVSFGYADIVLSVDDACAIIKILQAGRKIEYVSGGKDANGDYQDGTYHLGNTAYASMYIMPEDEFSKIVANGAKPEVAPLDFKIPA